MSGLALPNTCYFFNRQPSPLTFSTVAVRAEGVGHRVPTGFPDHHLTLSVEAEDTAGRPITPAGPVLPAFAGTERAGRL